MSTEEENNGLSLEAIAKRLEALERENERIRSENAELQHKVATMEGSSTEPAELPAPRDSDTGRDGESVLELDGKVSRRAMLTKAAAAAVAAVGAGTLLNARQAKADVTYFDTVEANYVRTHRVFAKADVATDVFAIDAEGFVGVSGFGMYDAGCGVQGQAIAPNADGTRGLGRGVNNSGVRAENPEGYGGTFQGGRAQLRLVPQFTAGKPSSGAHQKGEIYMDSTGALFVCTASGTPGTWNKITTTLVVR